jgi:hypothetical protein
LVKRLPPARPGKPHAAKVATDSPLQSAPAEEAEPTSPAAAPQPAAAAKPAAAQDTSAAGDQVEFNKEAARQALETAEQKAQSSCRTVDTPAGAARLAVTFAPSGNVISAIIESGPLVGTPAAGCVASKFRTVRVPPFTGDQVTVHKSVAF